MTRKQKKTPSEKLYEREASRLKATFWGERIRAGKEVKERYSDTANEVMQFFQSKHDHFYEGEAQNFMGFDGAATVSVPKVAQMKNSLGPRLYPSAPTRNVLPRGPDAVMLGLCNLVRAYLTYTAREATFARTMRRSIDDGLIRGRMMLRQVWDEVRHIVTSVHLSSLDVVFDPDFTEISDASWIAIRHREPLWQLQRRLPKWRLKGMVTKDHLADGGTIGADPTNDPDPDDGTDEKESNGRSTATVVEWWEVLSKMGCGFRGASLAKHAKAYAADDEEDFVRICVVLDHDCVLEEGEWDVPLYLDREWPISYEDLVETPGESWPESPMGQVLSLQKATDLLTSLRLVSCKNRDRVMILMDQGLVGDVQETMRHGSSADVVPIKLKHGFSLDSVVKIVDFGKGAQETALERDFLMKEMEVTLGTTSLITGGQDAQAKDRSATATQLRNSAAEVRTADMENKVAELMTDAARKEAIMLRLFVSEEDVAPFVKSSDIAMFWLEIPLAGGEPIPVRPTKMGKDREDDTLTLMDIYPGAATYFDTPQAAAEAALMLWQELQVTQDIRVMPLRDELLMKVDPMTGMPPIQEWIQPVTAERVWRDTAGLTAEELMRELAFDIEAGKGVKFDSAAERQSVDMHMQVMMPVLLQMGDIDSANKLLNMRDDAYKVPKDKRIQIKPPALPQQGQGQDGEESEGEDKPKSKSKGKK